MTNGRVTHDPPSPKEKKRWSSLPSESSHSPITPSSTSRDVEGEKLPNDVYLGSTSYSAVFTESQNHVQFQGLEDPDEQHLALAACQAKLKFGVTPARFQEGAEVLTLLSDSKKYEVALTRWFKVQCLASVMPFVSECIDMIAQSSSARPDSNTSLLKLSEQVFISTSNEFPIQSTTVIQDLPAILTGENLRWDMVGLILSTMGLSAISMDVVNLDPEDEECQKIDWKDMARALLIAGDKCISFCEAVDSLNDVTVWLIMLNYILHTQVEGDADAVCWRKLGGLTTAIFALGLHQEPKEPVRTPFFLKEIRRRTFWFAYICDKNFATFLGRPPMINSNFCFRQMPLGLGDEELSLNGVELQNALGNLTADGWNKAGRIDRASWLQTSIICCRFREEILEISLGSNTFALYDRAHDILRRQKEAYDALPPQLNDRSDRWVLERSTAENFFQLSKHMDPIYNEFLLHRALVKRLRVDPAGLIRASRSVLSPLLVLCGNRHRQGFYANDLPWLIALYGLPPAGVLALELLQQLSDRNHTPNPEFPRSEIIQKLSVLISSIECIVHPTNGNYGICGQAKKMLQAILDTVLAPTPIPAHAQEPANNSDGGQRQNELLDNSIQNSNSDATLEGFQMWFDNTNYDIDFWNNLEDHPLLAWPEVA